VTVVVPIYGDELSLLRCIDSLLDSVDLAVDSILLVNDNGPDADAIEASVRDRIAGTVVRYERNPSNLGFVGTCNRAALNLDTSGNDILLLNSDTTVGPGFLDELAGVLHSSPEHGIVCPRSNNATIASFPFKLRDPSAGRTVERSRALHELLAPDLPRFSVSPVSMGFCFLVRRELIDEFGLFDEIFAPGYGEENDFCLRMKKHGYLSLIANRVLVMHEGARSFTGLRRLALRASHEAILSERHPEYSSRVAEYLSTGMDAVDAYADALAPGVALSRVVIDLASAPTPQHSALLAAIDERAGRADVACTLAAPARLAPRLARRYRHLDVRESTSVDGLFDAALLLGETRDAPRLARLNRLSPRWVAVAGDGVHEATTAAEITERFEWTIPANLSPADAIERFLALGREAADPDELRVRRARFPADRPVAARASGSHLRQRVIRFGRRALGRLARFRRRR
jgi:GT2 family glycosyltransferase